MTRDGEPWFVDGQPIMRAEIHDFWAMVFNPSTVHRLVHVWLGCFIMGACLVLSISAYYLLRNQHQEFARKSFRGALFLCLFSCLAMYVSGHFQARMVYEHQPAKLAAFEAHFETGPADLSVIGIPDPENERINFNVSVPRGLSFLVHDNFSDSIIGLDRFAPADRPPVLIPYLTYHIMIAVGVGLTVLTVLATFLLWRNKLFDQRWLLWLFVLSIVPAIVGNEAGWVATEVGRQPWIVQAPFEVDEHGERIISDEGYFSYQSDLGLRTNDAVSKAITSEQVMVSIVMFGLIYLLLGVLWLYILNRKIQAGPIYAAPSQEQGIKSAVAGSHTLTGGP